MNRRNVAAVLGTAVLLISLPGVAASKPDFSGKWTLNLAKSDYGIMQAQAPQKFERVITQEGAVLKFTTHQSGARGEITTEMAYTTDGKPSINKTPRGEVTGTAKWDGNALVIASKREVNGATITQDERWTLSGDGKTLTIVNKIGMPAGDTEIRLVLEKQ